MPGMVAIVSAISDVVVAKLADAGFPPLADGKILLGRQHQAENHAPPRIMFVPMKSTFGPKDLSSAVPVALSTPYSPETRAQTRSGSVGTEFVNFEVRCWGQYSDSVLDFDNDYDFTQALYHAVIGTVKKIAQGAHIIEGGEWTDAKFGSSQIVKAGREFVFGLTFATPILDNITMVAPANTRPNVTTRMSLIDGSTETGCSDS